MDVFDFPGTVPGMSEESVVISGPWFLVGVGLDPLPMGAVFDEAVGNLRRMAAMAVDDCGGDSVWLSVDEVREQACLIFGEAPNISAVHLEYRLGDTSTPLERCDECDRKIVFEYSYVDDHGHLMCEYCWEADQERG